MGPFLLLAFIPGYKYIMSSERIAVVDPTTMQTIKFITDKWPRLGMIKGTKMNEVIVEATKAIIDTKTMKAMYAL
jgi:hypothetical protein